MHKKDSKTLQSDVLTADKPRNHVWVMTEEEEAENANLLKSRVRIVVKKTQYRSNREVIGQCFAAIVSRRKDKDKLVQKTGESRRILIRRRQKGT